MRKQYKKLAAALCAMMLLCGQIFGGVYVSASGGIAGMFDTWTGRGETSVRLRNINADTFLKLVNKDTDEEINPIYYIISADGSDAIVTLKEEYLQTLPNGSYTLTCYFSGDGQEIQMFGTVAVSPDPLGFELPSMSTRYTLTRLTYKGETVDPSYYTLSTEKGYPVITLKEGAPPVGDLVAYFSAEYLDKWVALTVDRQALPSEETTAAPPADSSEEPASAPPPVFSNEAAPTTELVTGGESDALTSDENMTSVSQVGSITSDAKASHPASSTQTGSDGENTNMAAAVMVAIIAVVAVAGGAALGLVLLKKYRNKKEDK